MKGKAAKVVQPKPTGRNRSQSRSTVPRPVQKDEEKDGSEHEKFKCPACGKNASMGVIECEWCEEWHHFACVGIEEDEVTKWEEAEWICPKCADDSQYETNENDFQDAYDITETETNVNDEHCHENTTRQTGEECEVLSGALQLHALGGKSSSKVHDGSMCENTSMQSDATNYKKHSKDGLHAADEAHVECGTRANRVKAKKTAAPTLPKDAVAKFEQMANENSQRNIETLGYLAGKRNNGETCISTLIIPKQVGTTSTCECREEEQVVAQIQNDDLILVGWIHTHPLYDVYMSSIDVHTQYTMQKDVEEAIAIVCATGKGRTGYYRLTTQGMETVSACQKTGFHEGCGEHVNWESVDIPEQSDVSIIAHDLRKERETEQQCSTQPEGYQKEKEKNMTTADTHSVQEKNNDKRRQANMRKGKEEEIGVGKEENDGSGGASNASPSDQCYEGQEDQNPHGAEKARASQNDQANREADAPEQPHRSTVVLSKKNEVARRRECDRKTVVSGASSAEEEKQCDDKISTSSARKKTGRKKRLEKDKADREQGLKINTTGGTLDKEAGKEEENNHLSREGRDKLVTRRNKQLGMDETRKVQGHTGKARANAGKCIEEKRTQQSGKTIPREASKDNGEDQQRTNDGEACTERRQHQENREDKEKREATCDANEQDNKAQIRVETDPNNNLAANAERYADAEMIVNGDDSQEECTVEKATEVIHPDNGSKSKQKEGKGPKVVVNTSRRPRIALSAQVQMLKTENQRLRVQIYQMKRVAERDDGTTCHPDC